jgi:Zn finger protein HypA/HybF involved in hydrogenase expression
MRRYIGFVSRLWAFGSHCPACQKRVLSHAANGLCRICHAHVARFVMGRKQRANDRQCMHPP